MTWKTIKILILRVLSNKFIIAIGDSRSEANGMKPLNLGLGNRKREVSQKKKGRICLRNNLRVKR
jgi:hypothetical protein